MLFLYFLFFPNLYFPSSPSFINLFSTPSQLLPIVFNPFSERFSYTSFPFLTFTSIAVDLSFTRPSVPFQLFLSYPIFCLLSSLPPFPILNFFHLTQFLFTSSLSSLILLVSSFFLTFSNHLPPFPSLLHHLQLNSNSFLQLPILSSFALPNLIYP